MKFNQEFIKAMHDKDIRSVLILRRPNEHHGNPYMRLCIEKEVYGQRKDIYVEHEVSVSVESYGGKKYSINELELCFHMSYYQLGSHVQSFLSTVGKNTQVGFHIRMHNNNDNYLRAGFTCHQLIGIQDIRYFLLDSFVGPENSACPVKVVYAQQTSLI